MDRYRMLPNYHFYDVEGTAPLTLESSVGKSLRDYKIYGNSVQDGTPTPENPVEIQCVGDLVTDETDVNYGKYKIPVEVGGNDKEPIKTNIYLDEPLYKIGEYADYIDSMNGKIVRNIKKAEFNGTESWSLYVSVAKHFQINVADNYFNRGENYVLSNYFPAYIEPNYFSNHDYAVMSVDGSRLRLKHKGISTVDEWKNWVASLDEKLTIFYRLVTPVEEDITLPPILTHKGTNIISVGTEVQPSNIQIQYYK